MDLYYNELTPTEQRRRDIMAADPNLHPLIRDQLLQDAPPSLTADDDFSLKEFLWQRAIPGEGIQFADRVVGRPYYAEGAGLSVGDFAGGGLIDMIDAASRMGRTGGVRGEDLLSAGFGALETVPMFATLRGASGLLDQVSRIAPEGLVDIPQSPQNREYFARSMANAQDTWGPIGRSVDVYDPEGYAGTTMFMTPDADAGFVVKPDGEVASVVKSRDATISDMAGRTLRRSEPEGGNWLNAFDTALTQMYGRNNFRPVSRLPFDESIVRSEWGDDATDAFMRSNAQYSGGRPDVVFMARDPSFGGPVAHGSGGQMFNDWDDATAALEAEMRRLGYID